MKADAKAADWSRLNKALGLRQRATPADLKRVVQGARRRLARGRQQQLATVLMMGINRIVVSDGKIGARAAQPAETTRVRASK